MPEVEQHYKRLTRTRAAGWSGLISTRSSLWLGSDHLLFVETNGYTESYKRFYFRDIQAVLIRQTRTRFVWAIVAGVLAGIFSLVAIAALGEEPAVTYLFGSFGVLLAAVLLGNLAAGPTCLCQLQTAVQSVALPSLARVKQARNLLDQVRPLIGQTQGQLAPEELPVRFHEWSASRQATGAPANAPKYVVDEPNVPPRIVS